VDWCVPSVLFLGAWALGVVELIVVWLVCGRRGTARLLDCCLLLDDCVVGFQLDDRSPIGFEKKK